jgi:hypothetical protein
MTNSKQSDLLAPESMTVLFSSSTSPSTSSHRPSSQKAEDEHGFLPVSLRKQNSIDNGDEVTIVSNFPSAMTPCDEPHFYLLLNDRHVGSDQGGAHGYFVNQHNDYPSSAKNQSSKSAFPHSHRTSSYFYSLFYHALPTGLLASSHSSSPHSRAESTRRTLICDNESGILNAVALRRVEYILSPIMILLGMVVLVLLSMALVEVMDRLWWRTMVPDEEQPSEDKDEDEPCYQDEKREFLGAGDSESGLGDTLPPPYRSRTRDPPLNTRKQRSKPLVPWALYSIPESRAIGLNAQELTRSIHFYKPNDIDMDGQDMLLEEEEDEDYNEEATLDSDSFVDSDDEYLDSFPRLM